VVLDSALLGVADEAYYKGGVIKCRDGSGRFSRDKLNDDFCDCPDGTDEPGIASFFLPQKVFFFSGFNFPGLGSITSAGSF
jgi:hypothetical protein